MSSVLYYSRCFEKHEISTISELNEIQRGSQISREDSNDEVCFFIRDLEKIWILAEIYRSIIPHKSGFFWGFTLDGAVISSSIPPKNEHENKQYMKIMFKILLLLESS